jgi:hypothetical protein
MVIGIALTIMAAAVIAQHIGLSETIAKVIMRIARCPKCMAMWSCAAGLWILGYNVVVVVTLSILMAYASLFFGFILTLLHNLYDSIWERLRTPRSRYSRRKSNKSGEM